MSSLIGIEEASKLLGVSISKLYKMVSSREVYFTKIGSRVLFDPEKLRVWVEERSVAPLGR